jgi:putative membrane protein
MGIIISLLASMAAVWLTSYVLPGVEMTGVGPLFWTTVVMGVLNAVLKPILKLLTFPINFMTLGLFTFVINAGMIMLTSSLVEGFEVGGFLNALLFSILLSVINTAIGMIVKK